MNKKEQTQSKLENHNGRFLALNVTRAKTGTKTYSAKIQKVTNKTVTFWDSKTRKSLKTNRDLVTVV